jgi:hypothetical protein
MQNRIKQSSRSLRFLAVYSLAIAAMLVLAGCHGGGGHMGY